MSSLITGIFASRSSAEHAVDDLLRAGFANNDISILMSETTRGREFAIKSATKAPEGAATGAAIGGAVGAILASLAAVGTIVVPGLALVAAGPIMAGLAGLGAGAATGGIAGGLLGLGVPENEAKFYEEEIRQGGILVGVYAHDDAKKRAKEILDHAGAEKVR